MKTLQKGFSLVELLVVVAIIGVLAGVGIVGYQGYTDSAKERVAVANYNSVKRFIDTELVLLNNNIQTTSASIKSFGTNCADTTTFYINTAGDAANNLEAFLKGIQCYFETTSGYGSAFKNPYDSLAQVQYAKDVTTAALKKGTINIELIVAADVTASRAGAGAVDPDNISLAASTTGGSFIVTYATADGVEGNTGEYIGKVFTLE
jgi:type IV pilus assembly protein PilA